MSSVVTKKKYTSVMEKIIKNAVSETTKVLETVIAELKAEVLRVTNENENLKIRCSQFEEVVKKRSVYRETGTSPEPWIIEKCDKAVQFDFILHHLDEDDDSPNISENDAQSEGSFGPVYEKETSNDSISFSRTTDTHDNSCTPLDLVNETMTEKTVADYGKNESENSQLSPDTESKASDTCYEPSEMKIQEDVCLKYSETDQSPMECQETTQQEQNENENLSFQEDNCIKYAETDQSLLECQETTQQKQNEKENISYPEDTFTSTEPEDITCEESNAHSKDCEYSLLLAPSPESACTSNAQTPAEEETSQMDDDIDRTTLSPSELKTENSSTADLTDGKFDQNVEQVETVACSEDMNTSKSPTESDQTCTRSDDTEGQSVLPKNIHAKDARNGSHSLSPPKSQYFLRRQRCSSVTLEDAMLLLDAVSQQKYKSSPPKKIHSTESFKNVPTPKSVNIPEVPANIEHHSEEFTLTTESLQPHAINSGVTMETGDAVYPTSLDTDNRQGLETVWSSKPSWPVEAVIEHDSPKSTPIKGKECLVTEADSAGLNIEGQQDQKIFSSSTESLVSLVTENPTPNISPTKLDETMHVADQTENIVIEEDEKTATSTQQSLVEHSFETSVPQDSEALQVELPSLIDVSASNASEETLSNPILQTPFEKLENNEQISCPSIHDSGEFQENDLQTTIFATQESSPLLSHPAQQTMVLKLSGDAGDQTSSVVKSITSPSTLSPAQLSAVVSAVRSTQMRVSPTSSVAAPSSKKGLVAVPFSLQSVMRPHHKIIVIPRQCKVPPSPQAVVTDKMVVMKQRALTAEATTTFISTTDVNQETTSGESFTMEQVNSMDQQHATSVDTSTLFIEPSSSSPSKSPCTNTVQIKLNRISFPVTSADSVSVTDMPENPEPKIIVRKRRGRPPSKRKNIAIDSNQTTAHPNKDSSHSPLTGSSPVLSSNDSTAVQITSSEQNVISAEENQSPPPEQLFPVVAKDHSYPQHCMTKSQFLAKLEVSPVTEISKKAVSLDKVAQKASLVDRLRSHLKPHIRTVKRSHKPEIRPDDSKLTVESENPTSCPTQEITQPHQDQQNENLLDAVPHNVNKNVSPKTPPSRRNVPNKVQVKRKRSPKRNMIPTKTVKRRNLKKTTKLPSTENIPARKCPISPMHNKIMNSNALLSCVRKGIKKKSFLCKFCRKEFAKKKDIEIHIQVHVGKKPFQCNICHRRFSRTMELSRHLKRHNAEKKYQCTSCGKAFIEYNNLKRHSYIHTGEKPFACPHCNRSFTQSGHMRAHIKNKHKDIKA